MEPKPSLGLLLNYFISVKAPLMQQWFLSYLPQEPGEEPRTISAATSYFSKGHCVPLFPQDCWTSLHPEGPRGSDLYPFAF